MASTPRVTLDDSYTLGITCAICGTDALKVNHVPNLPDYVACAECSSAFLVEEGGDRVFYGQIAAGYDETVRFALKQWAWLEAVETRAREERPVPTEIQIETPPEEIAPLPEAIQAPEDVESAVEGQSAEEWISSEIPAEDLREAASAAEQARLSGPEARFEVPDPGILKAEIPATADEDPFSFQPFDQDEQEPGDEIGLEDAEERSLADFFEALTDESGEVSPIAEPDAFVPTEEAPVETGFDPDLERLLQTEDDTGPELAPPPWATKRGPDSPSAAEEAPLDSLPSWTDFDELEPVAEGDAVPVVDAEEETYESLPSFKNFEEPLLTPETGMEPELPEWDVPSGEKPDDDLPAWAEFAEEETPETPAWALPAEEKSFDAAAEAETPDDLPWEAESLEEKTPAWQDLPQGFSEESVEQDNDFLAGLRRSAAVPLESQPVVDQPLSDMDDLEAETPWDLGADDLSARMESVSQPVDRQQRVAAGWEMSAAAAAAQKAPKPEPEPEMLEPVFPVEDEPYVPPASDPPPGQRYRVVIRGERVVFPGGDCAHCGRTPVKGKLAVAGTLPRGQTLGQRRPTRFEVPLCASCRARAAAKSEDAKAAQLQAHLISAIVGMVFVVGALALDLINPRDLSLADLFVGLILLIVGYGGPAFFLLNRVGNFLPPVDARYVRTTLLIPSETQGLETAFEWRNSEYAQHFHEYNQANTLGNVTGIKDRIG